MSFAADFVVTFGGLGAGLAFDFPFPLDAEGAESASRAGIPGTKSGTSARRPWSLSAAASC